ncbi:MAG: hypothetical protein M3R61_01520 [Chloroflexota bacterium]|nr:hypothetical protein [Chloroflexota bacterium]
MRYRSVRRTPALRTFVMRHSSFVSSLSTADQPFSAIITRMHTRDDIKRLTELASCAG